MEKSKRRRLSRKRLKEPKVSEERLYGLRHIESGNLLRVEIQSNDGRNFCGDSRAELDHNDWNEHHLYTTDEMYKAEYVRNFSTPWYNSSEETPQHDYEPEELQVVEIHRIITITPKKVKIPTWVEYAKIKYKEKDPEHFKHLMEDYQTQKYQSFDYGLYGLQELIQDKKWTPPKDKTND
jgi:hypothetical protein